MKYTKNDKAIGERIKECRKALPDNVTQEQFGKMLMDISEDVDGGYSRKTIASWEKGNPIPPLDALIKMCEIFDCELGYLLCEHDTKTRAAADIQNETGLNEAAIDILRSSKYSNLDADAYQGETLHLINHFILNCKPIVESITELNYRTLRLGLDNQIYPEKQNIFNRIYDGDYPEHMKPLLYIDTVIDQMDHGWCGEGAFDSPEELQQFQNQQRDLYFQDYLRFADNRRNDKVATHRYNINLTFNQIIDGILEDFQQSVDTSIGELKKEEDENNG